MRPHETNGQRDSSYRRGAVMGLTLAEAFILIAFALLLLFTLWQWQLNAENTEEVQRFKELSPDQQKTMIDAVQAAEAPMTSETVRFRTLEPGEQEKVMEAVDAGVFQDPAESWRFITQSDLKRLLDGAQELPEDVRRQLAELVQAEEAQQVLSELGALEEIVEAGQSLSGISERIGQLQAEEAELADDLRAELGGLVANLEGQISDDGSITLPENVVFEQGSSQVSPRLRGFLRQACQPWLAVLKTSDVPISEVRIEGHASSEWRFGSTLDEAYLGNLDLSQRRSQNVLLVCLDYVADEDIKAWARSHLVAVGHSSSRPVLTPDGKEDPEKSRRVVFRVIPDREDVLEDIEREAEGALSRMSYGREMFGAWVDADGDCLNTRHELLEERSEADVVLDSEGCAVVTGEWRDPYTGNVLTRASSIELDHVVPLAWAWKHGASAWTDEQRRAFARDQDNILLTESTVNRSKGASGPLDWLPPGKTYRCDYLVTFLEIIKDYGLEIDPQDRIKISLLMNDYCA